MEKLCDRIDWNNNTSPALNDTNLNLMSKAIDDIDDRVIAIAGTVMETVPQIQEDLEEAQDLLEDAEAISTHPPIIGQNGNWWTWDTTIEDYADSGIDAGVSLTIGTTSTLTPGSDATVTNSGTATDPILNFGIPAGVAGQNGQDGADGADGADGVSPTVTIGTITGGHTVTITDADHPTGQSFNVMDGEDGADGVGVPSGGTTGQVLKKKSGTNYDTEWDDEEGGGHTILNGSGSAMTQRTNLQFVGATVSDDSANDKTIVTTTPQSMIGDEWVSGHAYAVRDYCIDGNVLYKCKTAHTSTASNRPPYASYWDAVNVAGELKNAINEIMDVAGYIKFNLFVSGQGVIGLGQFTLKNTYSGGTITISNNYIELLRTGSDDGSIKPYGVFTNPIDLTPYKKLVVRAMPISGQSWNYYSIAGGLNTSNSSWAANESLVYCNTVIDSSTGLREGTKDLSNITGLNYLWLGCAGQRSCRITEIFLSRME